MAKPKTRINLYRPVLATRASTSQHARWWLLGIVLFVVLLGVGYVIELRQGWQLAKKVDAKRADLDQLKTEINGLDGQLKLLTSGVSTDISGASAELVAMLNQRLVWIDLFREMSVRVPEGVWLLRVDVVAMDFSERRRRAAIAPEKTSVLGGFARSHRTVGEMLSALEQSPHFSSVTLKFARQKAGHTGGEVDFEITGQLV